MLDLEREAVLTDRDLGQIVRLVYDRSGITLHEGKRSLVTARLQKRLRVHGFGTFADYLKHIEGDSSGGELVELLDAIATNHTGFFREARHFDLLVSRVVPEWRARPAAGPLRVWSAACSTGEEPYTIAMTLRNLAPAPEFTILASDLSTKALRVARAATYQMQGVAALPRETLRAHFERGLGAQDGLVRVAAAVRGHVRFRHLNLLEIGDLPERYDVVFCRNVMIYFDRQIQQRVVSMLERQIAPGGYLFISHAESLNEITHRLRWVAPAVYQRVAR